MLEIPNATRRQTENETIHQEYPSKHVTNIGTYLKKQYSKYISPIEEYLVGSKILVVREGLILKVPFCALLNSTNEHPCEKYSLQFTQALHVLNSCLSTPWPKLGPALFVGNPMVGEGEG